MRIAIHLAWRDIRSRYAATVLGSSWTTISMFVTAAALAFVYSTVFSVTLKDYLPYLIAGLVAWYLISTALLEAPSTFTLNRSMLLNTTLPLRVYAFQAVARNMIVFAQSLPVALLVTTLLIGFPGANLLWLLPSCLLLFALLSLWTFLIGFAGVRFPDVGVFMPSLILIIFLLTPIFWPVSALGERTEIIRWNPFYWLVESVRAPLLGIAPSWGTWLALIGGIAVAIPLAVLTSGRYQGALKAML